MKKRLKRRLRVKKRTWLAVGKHSHWHYVGGLHRRTHWILNPTIIGGL